MRICHLHRVVFLEVPRTASRSISRAMDWCRAEDITGEIPGTLSRSKHIRSHVRMPRHYSKFCVVRNPIQRHLSAWAATRTSADPGAYFDELMRQDPYIWAPQVEWSSLCDLVWRFERIDEIHQSVPCVMPWSLDSIHIGRRKRAFPEWTPPRRFIEFYRADFETFGYEVPR